MQEEIAIAKELVGGLLDLMGLKAEVEPSYREGSLYIGIQGEREGVLIGRHGRTLDALQIVISRMINKRLDNPQKPVRVILDVNDYLKRRAQMLNQMALRFGEKVRRTGRPLTIGPFNAHDRRIIHVALKEEPALKTESLGEGDMKKVAILPNF